MIIVKRSQSPIAQKLDLGYVLLDDEKHEAVAYFYDERAAIIAARALNRAAKKRATRKS